MPKPGSFKPAELPGVVPVEEKKEDRSRRERIQERLTEVRTWLKEVPENSDEASTLKKEEEELLSHLSEDEVQGELKSLSVALSQAETSKEEGVVAELLKKIAELHKKLKDIVK